MYLYKYVLYVYILLTFSLWLQCKQKSDYSTDVNLLSIKEPLELHYDHWAQIKAADVLLSVLCSFMFVCARLRMYQSAHCKSISKNCSVSVCTQAQIWCTIRNPGRTRDKKCFPLCLHLSCVCIKPIQKRGETGQKLISRGERTRVKKCSLNSRDYFLPVKCHGG